MKPARNAPIRGVNGEDFKSSGVTERGMDP